MWTNNSGLAPSNVKIGSMVLIPTMDKIPTKKTTVINAVVATKRALTCSLAPKSLPITAEVPMPSPIFKLITVNVTGNVKLIAASSCVPNRLTKNVSTKPNVINMIMPKIIGMVISINVFLIFPSSIRFAGVVD